AGYLQSENGASQIRRGCRLLYQRLRFCRRLGLSWSPERARTGLSDIDDLDGAIAAVSAALRPRGCFVFSILHPCFAGGKDVSGSWPTAGSYYDEGFWTAQEALSTLRRQVGANHRMLSTYLNALRRHSLWLDKI